MAVRVGDKTMHHKAVFIDKDGTLIENVPYNVNPKLIQFTDGMKEGLKLLSQAGYKLIIISNQSGIARGKFKEEELLSLGDHLCKKLEKMGVPIAGFYYCPHHPGGKIEQYSINCFCRKPNPGMLFQASRDHSINLAESWMVGDILDDMEAGRRTECRTIMINNGNETEWRLTSNRRPHFVANNMLEVAELILAEQDRPRAQIVSHKLLKTSVQAAHTNARV